MNDFMIYIWARHMSKKIFDAELDPETSELDIARKFNKMNVINQQNFTYDEIVKLVAIRLNHFKRFKDTLS